MEAQAANTKHPPVFGLHHAAYQCRDAEETRQFYEDVVGFPLSIAMPIEANPQTGDPLKYLHLFFDIGSHDANHKNYIAFFDMEGYPDDDPNDMFVKRWGLDLHFAMRVKDHDAVHAWRDRLVSKGVEVEGPINHGMCTSIYFYDPNGYRLEFTTESAEESAEFARHRRDAGQNMQDWLSWKAENASA